MENGEVESDGDGDGWPLKLEPKLVVLMKIELMLFLRTGVGMVPGDPGAPGELLEVWKRGQAEVWPWNESLRSKVWPHLHLKGMIGVIEQRRRLESR